MLFTEIDVKAIVNISKKSSPFRPQRRK